MEKADITRRKFIDDLYQREKEYASGHNAEQHLTPSQAQKRRKEEESRIRSEFETLRQRLEKEAADEIHAQQERIARLVREQTKVKTNQEASEEKHATLRVKWKPSDDSDYDESRLRNIYEKYGTISTITPIRTTKKGDRVCMIEFEVINEDCNAESEIGKDGPDITGNWIIPPRTPNNGNNEEAASTEKHKDYSSMTYEELQAQLFADVGPLGEKRKKWHEEE
ncbi:hypothetical protein KIN20_004680 [Parelaphostrongylus tenuis]|uniref:RRM domain-containing protein n=1 Tax=Parelaphostrongylus tenuis TaxID=148309 RepID=A0AAD5QH04_PARTN|nr:hypothetical protein KIN20_004680 [Parelaphostrongylus tenuis]